MKKFISLVLAVLMAFSVASVAVSAEETGVDCTHEFGKWVISVDETCSEDGIKLRECALCGKIETDFIKATGHTYGEGVVTDPTCSSKGYTTYTCSKCDETKTENEVPALAHTYGEWTETLAPACLTAGTRQKVCTICDETAAGHVLTEAIPALGHNYKVTVVDPTYTADGYNLHECPRCGDSYKDTIVEMLKGKLEGIDLGSKITVMYGDLLEIKPTLDMKGTVKVTYKYVSSAENVATVDDSGNVKGMGLGTAKITCTATDEYGNVVTDTVDVQVNFSIANWFEVLIGILKAAIEIVLGGLDFSSLLQLIPGLGA